jgi:hypothetical protein
MAGIPRFKSRIYILCFVTVALYVVIITFLLVGESPLVQLSPSSQHPNPRARTPPQARRLCMCDWPKALLVNLGAVV